MLYIRSELNVDTEEHIRSKTIHYIPCLMSRESTTYILAAEHTGRLHNNDSRLPRLKQGWLDDNL